MLGTTPIPLLQLSICAAFETAMSGLFSTQIRASVSVGGAAVWPAASVPLGGKHLLHFVDEIAKMEGLG